MAGVERMTIDEVVRQVLRDERADVIRESSLRGSAPSSATSRAVGKPC